MEFLGESMTREWDVDHSASIKPEDLLHFIYLDEFRQDWESLHPGDKDQMVLWMLEITIMSNPEGPPVIPGTGGLRKLRMAHDGAGGKSGGDRVCYAYFPKHHSVVMVIAYAKNEQDNLSPDEKKGIKKYLDYVRRLMDEKA